MITLDLSIIVPVFNGERYLRWSLQSLADLPSELCCEVIIQNGCSTDSTGVIAAEFCHHRAYWHHIVERDDGQSDAINKGMQRAKGRWVTWLCADDLLLPAIAGALVEAELEQSDIVYGDVFFATSSEVIPAEGTEDHVAGRLAGRRLLIQQPGTCIRRTVWHQAHGVNAALHWSMDYDLLLRLEAQGRRFLRCRKFVALARIHPEAKTSSGSMRRLLELWHVLAKAHFRRPEYTRFRPYLIYGLEYLIKNLESRAWPPKTNQRVLSLMHRLFWQIAVPMEIRDIRFRFDKALSEISPNFQKYGIPARGGGA